MKFRIEHLLIIGLFIYVVFIQTCNSNPGPEKEIVEVETFRVDSFEVVTVDTFRIEVPAASVPLIASTNIDSVLKSFTYVKKDSLLSYEITVESEIEPKDVKIKYDVSQFSTTKNVYIRDSTYAKEVIKRSFLSLGGQLIGSKNSFGFAPTIMYSHKTGNNFSLGYDVLNSNLHLTYTKKLSFR